MAIVGPISWLRCGLNQRPCMPGVHSDATAVHAAARLFPEQNDWARCILPYGLPMRRHGIASLGFDWASEGRAIPLEVNAFALDRQFQAGARRRFLGSAHEQWRDGSGRTGFEIRRCSQSRQPPPFHRRSCPAMGPPKILRRWTSAVPPKKISRWKTKKRSRITRFPTTAEPGVVSP